MNIDVQLRRCPEDLNLKEFTQRLQKLVKTSGHYKGYRVFNVKLNNFVALWNEQITYSESMKSSCIASCEQGRLFALIPE